MKLDTSPSSGSPRPDVAPGWKPNVARRAGLLVMAVLAIAGGAAACVAEEEPVKKDTTGRTSSAPRTHAQAAGKPDLVVKDAQKELEHTRVVGVLDSTMRAGTSLIWCSTIGLAWNELGPALGGAEDLTLGEPNELASKLNDSPASKADLDDESYLAMGGLGRDGILGRVRKALEAKFGGAASPSALPDDVQPDEVLAYAYLFKNLEFATPFLKRQIPLTFGGAAGAGGSKGGAAAPRSVGAFGLWHDEREHDRAAIRDQIDILAYESPGRWACELKSKAAEDRLIIARLDPRETLGKTVEAALAMKAEEPLSFGEQDTLVVPYANFDITRSYTELVGLTVSTGSESATITKAVQNIRLKLDERGAVLKSDAGIVGVTSAPIARDPKRMVCDGPFLVIMMRRGAEHPYFAMWVDNPELLVAWKK